MIKRFILLFTLVTLLITDSKAQDPAAQDNACSAMLFCSTGKLNGYSNKIQLPTSTTYPKPRGFCGEMDAPSWFRFVAESATLELRFNYLNCGLGTSGFQAGIFSTTDCADTAEFNIVSNCINLTTATGTGNLLANGLVAGQTYYLLVDGYSGSQCDYDITVVNGTIRTVATGNLTAPLAIYGPTDICNNSATAVFSVPKNPTASEYIFNISINGNPPAGGSTQDSFYTFNTLFTPVNSIAVVSVSYNNNCDNGPARNLNVNIGTSTKIELPPIILNFGESITAADSVFAYGPTPKPSDEVTEVYFTRPDATFSGCDTNFHVTVTRLAKTAPPRAYFLRPGETLTLGGTTYSVSAANCNLILASSGDTIYNAVQTYAITPTAPNLTCNSVRLFVNKVDSCNNMLHFKTHTWYTTNGSGGLLLYGTGTSQLTSTADSFVVVIKDSVMVKGSPLSGYKVYFDTLKVRVTGVGGSDRPSQPTTITGTNTACQGVLMTYSLASFPPKADSLIWSTGKGSGTIVSGQGTRNVTVLWNGTQSIDTLKVIGKNACFSSISRDMVVNITTFPNLSAGKDTALCGLSTNLAAISSGGVGNWTSVASNPSVVGFNNSALATAMATVTSGGIYKLAWTETKGTCTLSDTVSITFSPAPQVAAGTLRDSCSATRTQAYARFNITNGTAPYNVFFSGTNTSAGTVSAGGLFQSVAFTPGNYSFEIRDSKNCSPSFVQGTQACLACTTNAGSLQAGSFSICEGDSVRATFLGGSNLEPDDTLQFVLHSGDPKTGIISKSRTPNFAFTTGMTYETIYYISSIAGNKIASGVDLTDPCFSASNARQVEVIFHRNPTAVLAVVDSNLCLGSCASLNFTVTGRSPYTITARISDPTTRDTTWGLLNSSSITYCPKQNTTFRLYSIKDANNCSDSVKLVKTINFTVTQPVVAGPDTSLTVCGGVDTTINLSNLLRGATTGGTWTEISASPSSGTAFNATAGTFRTRNQVSRTYNFRYIIRPVTGSVCNPDTAVIKVNIQAIPLVDAGQNDTITCYNPIITIGGSTPTGTNVTIQWTSVGGRLGGNAPLQEVSQADTYIITATSNGCVARDSVVVSVDTTSPRAVILPITDSLTCRRDTITLNGSFSLPNNLVYLWLYEGIPYDVNPTTIAGYGGHYELAVLKLSNGCISVDSVNIIENRILPTISIEPPSKLNCRDTIVTLNALASSYGTGYTFKWDSQNNGHFLSDSTTLEPKVDSSGLYQLVITDTRNGCADSNSVTVIREVEIPTANAFASDTLDCYHKTINLSARGSTLGVGLTYEWIANPGNIVSGETTVNATVDQPGLYYFIATNTKTGCSAIDSVRAIRNDERPQVVDFTTQKPKCYGEQNAAISIASVTGGTAPFLYSLDGSVFTQRNTFSNLNAGTYKLYVQDASGCVLDSTFNIVQDRQIGVSMGLDTTIKLGDSILLSVGVNTPDIKRVLWNIYTDSLCSKDSSCLQQWVNPVRQTTYKVTVIDTGGCKATGSITVSIDKTRPIYVPTAFSPNNDGVNDVFMVYGSQVVKNIKRFQVFDRWGEMMVSYQNFNTDNPAFGWDGKLNGREAQSGVYPYFVEVEYLDGALDIIEGSVTLVR